MYPRGIGGSCRRLHVRTVAVMPHPVLETDYSTTQLRECECIMSNIAQKSNNYHENLLVLS